MLNKPKRLAIIMPTFFEQITGGAEYQAYLLAGLAKQKSIEVHYIFVSEHKLYPNDLGLQLHTIKPIRLTKRCGAIWSFYLPSVYRFLKNITPDAVYVRGGWSFSGLATYYAKHHGCKSTWHVAHQRDVTPAKWLICKRPLDLIERKFINYAIHYSTHVIAQANYQADLLAKYFGRKSEVIFNGQPEPYGELTKNVPIIVAWVANIKLWKQPEMFIRLAAEFHEDDRLSFVMIGRPSGGEYQEKLNKSMEGLSNFQYLGARSLEEVNQLLAKAHIFVNTSIHEGFANSFIQAWMRKVPVVSMLFDPDDILVKQRIGFCSGSYGQMVQDIAMLIDNPDLRNEMGARARSYALEHHSLSGNMERLLGLILS